VAIEQYAQYFHETRGMPTVIFRVANPYGLRQHPDKPQGIIPVMLRRVAQGLPLDVIGDGSAVRDYLFVTDMADMISLALSHGTRHTIYNIGSGTGVSVAQIVTLIEEITGVLSPRHHLPAPASYVRSIVLDTTRFVREFNSRPMVGLFEGISTVWDGVRRPMSGPRGPRGTGTPLTEDLER